MLWVTNPLVLAQTLTEVTQTRREEVRVVVVLQGKGVKMELPCMWGAPLVVFPLDHPLLAENLANSTDPQVNSVDPQGLGGNMVSSPLENLQHQHQVTRKD